MTKQQKGILGAIAVIAIIVLIVVLATPREEPAVEEPVVEDPVVEDPVVEDPVVEDPVEPVEPDIVEMVFKESPLLTEMVDRGDIPPVAERLPVEPKVIQVVDRIGVYGGTFRHFNVGGPGWELFGLTEASRMFRGDGNFVDIKPSIARDYELSEDFRKLTIFLREGLRWSDGELFTADDILFAHEHVNLNTDIRPGGLTGWREGMQIRKIDDLTVEITLQRSHPNLLRDLSRLYGQQPWFFMPEHFMRRFHGEFGDAAQLDAWVEAAGVEHWSKLPIWGADWHSYMHSLSPEEERMPTLDPFIVVEADTERRLGKRNPYFWMVDPEGNQLPYIDYFESLMVTDGEVLEGKTIAGEMDFRAGTLANHSLYLDHAERANFRVLIHPELFASAPGAIQFNMTYEKDPFLGELFRNPKFRQAISLSINRDEINEAIFFGMAEPAQATVLPVSRWYREERSRAFVEFDPDRANQMLDELGLDQRDADGFRLRPDGQRLSIMFEVPGHSPVDDLLVEQWRDVGLEFLYHIRGDEIFGRASDNDVQMWRWMLDKMTDVMFPFDRHAGGFFVPVFWAPGWNVEGVWATNWARWFHTDGAEGSEPPAEYKELIEAWETSITTLSAEERDEMVHKILDFQAENLNIIGLVRLPPRSVVVHNRLQNVPDEEYAFIWDLIGMFPYYPAQWFIEE